MGATYLRFVLFAFACFYSFGFPDPSGTVETLSRFAIPAFFTLSGYFVLCDDEQRRSRKIVRKIKRTALWFVCILIGYIIVNVVFCLIFDVSVVFSKRVIFEFIVLDQWPLPIGINMWFIQAELYAYIVIFILDKLKLLRFYKIILAVSLLFMLLTGELAGVIHFNFLGYDFINSNWLTRALPYILLGMLMRKNTEFFLKFKSWGYLVMFILGIGLSLCEIYLLNRFGALVYIGHMIGYGVMAFAACGWAIKFPWLPSSQITKFGTAYISLMYALSEPAYYVLLLALEKSNSALAYAFIGPATFLVIAVAALSILNVREYIIKKRNDRRFRYFHE